MPVQHAPTDQIRVWRATTSDVLAAARVLTEAFADYPWTRFTVAADNHLQRIQALQRLLLERVALPYGPVHLATAGNDRAEPDAVAVWLPPEPAVPEAEWTHLAGLTAELLGDRARAAADADAASVGLRPATPTGCWPQSAYAPANKGEACGELSSHRPSTEPTPSTPTPTWKPPPPPTSGSTPVRASPSE